MRKYAKVSPRLWTGRLGLAMRGDAMMQVVAFYLLTGPHANLAGLYLLPVVTLADDIGHGARKVRTALRKL